jgi:4-aminobutyrate aminotransferase / (S)-3-amino-2-methylpropionate transaminase / 5-aminovalerate transaminase
MTGLDLANIVVPPPGPNSRRLAAELRQVESRNITYVSEDFPVFFESGAGANLVDVDGNRYVDLSGAFAVAAAGHSNDAVASAVARQARTLLHGMGDVHPTPLKVELARVLCELAPGDGPKRVIFASSGAEAVEAAIKTAAIASGKPGVLCFTGAYHGLTYGALAVTDRDLFRAPFADQLGGFATRVPYAHCYRCPIGLEYPRCEAACLRLVEEAINGPEGSQIGAVIVEPIQGRGGDIPAPLDWLAGLRAICDRHGLVMIADEIYTGFGRTGKWFACEHAGVIPDLLCVGKGMASGFPISACVGKSSVMDRWPESGGEAIHTSTFLGNPAGCAAALASIAQIRERGLVERAAVLEPKVRGMLEAVRSETFGRIGDIRGRGLMWGVECVDADGRPDGGLAIECVTRALRRGVVMLAAGPAGNVLQLAPPLVIDESQLAFGVRVIADSLIETLL